MDFLVRVDSFLDRVDIYVSAAGTFLSLGFRPFTTQNAGRH